MKQSMEQNNNRDLPAVVIGGGIGGMACAIALGELGRRVILVEKEENLGGQALRSPALGNQYGPLDPALLCRKLTEEISGTKGVEVKLGSRATGIKGSSGKFMVKGIGPAGEWQLEAAAVILATGFRSKYDAGAYGFEETGFNVCSFTSFEKIMRLSEREKVQRFRGKRIGFVVDVSTRDSKNFISRALKYSRYLNENYGTESFVFCKDVKVAGYGLEAAYRESRISGTLVLKYEGTQPRIEFNAGDDQSEGRASGASAGEITVYARIPSLGPEFRDRDVAVPLDMLVLDEAIRSANSLSEFKDAFGALDTDDGFFQAANVRLQPVDTGRPGLWVLGGCRGDLDVEETLADAWSTANRVDLWLSGLAPQKYITIDAEKCARCLTCVRLCPSRALHIEPYAAREKSAAQVDDLNCRGCGICAAACPAKAISFVDRPDEQILEELKALGGKS